MNTIVRYVREQMGLTQQELAEIAGVSRQTISAIEKGKYNPSLLLAYKLSVLLGCSSIEEVFILEEQNVFEKGELEELKKKYKLIAPEKLEKNKPAED